MALHYLNHAGMLVRTGKLLSYRCPDCGHRGYSRRVRKTCPECHPRYGRLARAKAPRAGTYSHGGGI